MVRSKRQQNNKPICIECGITVLDLGINKLLSIDLNKETSVCPECRSAILFSENLCSEDNYTCKNCNTKYPIMYILGFSAGYKVK